jgi:ABC-type bacteriocin/lantibiotic exporter with double-glycine peptidase domain
MKQYIQALIWVYQLISIKDISLFIILVVGGLLAALLESLSILSIIPLVNSIIGSSVSVDNSFIPNILFDFNIELVSTNPDVYLWIFVSLFFISSIYRLALLWTQTIYVQRISHKISITIFKSYLSSPFRLVRDLSESEITSISINKCNEFGSAVVGTIFSVSNSIFFLLIVLSIFQSFNIFLVLSISVIFLIVYGSLFTVSNRILSSYATKISGYLTNLLNVILEASRARKEIELGFYSSYFDKNFENIDKKIRQMRANVLVLGVFPKYLVEIIVVFSVTLLVSENTELFVVNFPIFGAAILAIHRLMPLLNQLYSAFTNFRAASVMVEEVIRFVKCREINKHVITKESCLNWDSIKVEDLHFRHKNLRGLRHRTSCEFYRGKRYIITGPSGSGKTTLLYCIAGIEVEFQGQILLKGSMSNNHRGLKYALVSQHPFIHRGTVADNLHFDKSSVDPILVKNICDLLNIKTTVVDDEIHNQLTLETVCGENGMNLSGGQRQRVALARVLLQEFDILLCDESLSAVEYSLEAKIIEGMIQLIDTKCLIYVSHRPELKRYFDEEITIQ